MVKDTKKIAQGIDLKQINKDFDSMLFSKANEFRQDAAKSILDSKKSDWKNYEIQGGMLATVLERRPFENTEEILKFNIAVTEVACDRILGSEYSLIEKIGMYANAVEIGAREFISPRDSSIVLKNLSAAKERGFFFTPPSVAIRMVITSLDHAKFKQRVLDPAAGVGVFLAYHILLNPELKHVTGIEIDAHTADLAQNLLKYVASATQRLIKIDVLCNDFLDYCRDEDKIIDADIIIMNPPYGAVKVLASDLTDESTKANLSQEEIITLEKKLKKQIIDYAACLRKQFSDYGIGKGTLEYSKLFMAATLKVLPKEGIIVAITPSSWLGDETSSCFRKNIISRHYLHEIWVIPEKAKLFKGVNQPTAVSVLCKEETQSILVHNPVLRIEDVDNKPDNFDVDIITSVSGEKAKFPQCSEEELTILKHIQDYKRIKDIGSIVNMRGELDLTAYKDFVSTNDTGHRLIRGDHIEGSVLTSSEASDKAGYVLYDEFLSEIEKSEKSKFICLHRIAIPQCSYLQKKKRIEAAIILPNTILANSCNFITLSHADITDSKLYYYWMMMNSSVIEWQFRIFSYNNHVANKEIDALGCVPYEELSKAEIEFVNKQHEENDYCDEFTVLQDAFIARVFKLSEEEYSVVLNGIGIESKEEYLDKYRCMKKKNNQDTIPQHQMPTLSELDKEMISYVEPGGNWTSIPETVPSKRLDQIREMAKKRGMVRTTYYSRLKYNQPAYTISTYFNRPGNGANIHPWEDRTLSAREAARLQSFPDNFIFEGNEAAVRTQIGNAVPPLLGYAIGKAIKKKNGSPIKFCDMFAGAGGLSYGMELAGFKGVVALELNKHAAATFARNHNKEIQTIVGDINDEGIQQELDDSIKNGREQNEPWVLVGGPPCQGFSTAGYRDENDIRNKLVDSYLKFIKKTQPTIVVMENVPGILSMKKGDVIRGVYQSLQQLGYVFHQVPWVLDAERYGVPQMRRRVIIVAAKSKDFLPDFPEPVFEKCLGRREQEEYQMSLQLTKYPITVGEALKGLPALMKINDYYPENVIIDDTYSKWCKGEITAEELLEQRG